MAEKKRGSLSQRIGIGLFLGILGVSVGLGVYEGFDKEIPVVRDVEMTDKTVHNKDKNGTPSDLVEATHKDKNGRVLIRVLGKDKESAERLLAKEIAKSVARDRETDDVYEKEVKEARKGADLTKSYSEKESYALLEEDVSTLFSVRFGTSKKEVMGMLSGYDDYTDGMTFTKKIGVFDVKISLTLNKDERIEGYSMRVSSEDVSVLRSSSDRLRTLLSLLPNGDREFVGIGVRGLEEKRAYTLMKTGK